MLRDVTASELLVVLLLVVGTSLLVLAILQSLRPRGASESGDAESEGSDPGTFVYITIPEDIGPLDRGTKYEDPLQEKLEAAGLGEVTGGGSRLSEKRPGGTRIVESCDIDVEVVELDPALALLRRELPVLGAPQGTEIHYTRRGVELVDHLTTTGWRTGDSEDRGTEGPPRA